MDQAERDHSRQLAIYDQNYETFRSLNQLMWQIPLIAMTLTGGLWFGVSAAEASPIFQVCLLALAAAGNLVLIGVLNRLRYIMGQYLEWLKAFDQWGFVAADGKSFWTRPLLVRSLFQTMLLLATLISGALMISTVWQAGWMESDDSPSDRSLAFYDRTAEDLVDSYEAVSFERAHPYLVQLLSGRAPIHVMDIGAGSGRDAAAITALGHSVVAVEPSDQMRRLARALHAGAPISWVRDALPDLKSLGNQKVGLIVLSAVWMHIHPEQRPPAIERLSDLLLPGGEIYLTLRSGPADLERAIYPVSVDEVARLAAQNGLTFRDLGGQPDLLGRASISWRSVVLSKPGEPKR